jgi:LysR family nitrogen assimilation transcriptional regulator
MELRTLRYFVQVAEAESFSRAGEHLRVAQPALSRQIRKLEDELGPRLFVRTGRRIELTEAGQLLLVRARALLRQAANLADEVRTASSDLSGTVSVGISPAVSEMLAPIVFEGCRQDHPNLRVQFVEGFSRLIMEQLLNQELTLCLLHNPPAHAALSIHPIVRETMYLIGPASRASDLPPVEDGMYTGTLPLILPNESHALRILIERGMAETGEKLNVAVQTDGLVTTRALVIAGCGYTILPYSSVHDLMATGRVSAARLSHLNIPWTLSLASRTDKGCAAQARAILETILARRDLLLAPERPNSK